MDSNVNEQDRSHLGVVLNPTVKVKPGEKFKEFMASHSSAHAGKQYLSIGDIKELYAKMQTMDGVYLNDFMGDSEIVLPTLVVPQRNPELDKRIDELKKNLAQKEYNRMTRDVDLSNRYKPTESLSFQSMLVILKSD
jgi:predicted esterase YcpF (UPF0227 family)